MNNILIPAGVAVLVVVALVAFAFYRWRMRKRVHQVEAWVKQFLFARYDEHPQALSINCSEDRLWPVLVAFQTPRTRIRHRLQFACAGPPSTYALLSEIEENA